MPDVALVPFKGYEIQSWKDEQNGNVYVGMRRVCQDLRLNWAGQSSRLTTSSVFAPYTIRMDIYTERVGKREALGLNLEMFPLWLSSVNANKVAPAVRETLLMFQRESAQALRDYWFNGSAVNSRVEQPPAVMSNTVQGTPLTTLEKMWLLEHARDMLVADNNYTCEVKKAFGTMARNLVFSSFKKAS